MEKTEQHSPEENANGYPSPEPFLKDSPIIILDEIAASLDVENEKKIQDSLNRLILDKTVVIISHRLKSVENADKIVVIDCGRVEASGTHLELLKTSPTYNNLVEKSKTDGRIPILA